MNCEQATERWWLQHSSAGQPPDAALQSHLSTCAACREATQGLATLWEDLGRLPDSQPSSNVQVRFDAMLAAYQHGARVAAPRPAWSDGLGHWLEGWWPRRPAMQFGLAMALLVLGVGLGAVMGGRNMGALRQEVQSTRAMIALSLLQQRSPSDRLQGVAYSTSEQEPSADVMEALLTTLDSDPSVNVRLATIDALLTSNSQRVRDGLLAALPRQTSPLVQIAVIDAMVQLHETNAMPALEKLAADTDADRDVRQRAQWAVQQLKS